MRDSEKKRAQQWLEELLKLMNIPTTVSTVKAETNQGDSDPYWLVIDETKLTPEQTDLLIGEKGETIDAIQYLTNTILHIGADTQEQMYFTVELNGYRVSRQAELFDIAKKAAEQVRATGVEVAMPLLSSAERRQIHSFLEQFTDIETESRGQEPDRRLVVKPR